MQGVRVAAIWAMMLVSLVTASVCSYGQSPITHRLAWQHETVVRIDSVWTDYHFPGLSQSTPGAEVQHEATYSVASAGMGGGVEPYVETSVYVRAPFAVEGIPSWLRREGTSAVSLLRSRGEVLVHVSLPAFRMRSGEVEILSEYRVGFRRVRSGTRGEVPDHFMGATRSVLSSGHWVGISVDREGVYKLTYERLVQSGFSEPGLVSVWGHNGRQLPYENSRAHSDDLRPIPLQWVIASGQEPGPGDYALCYLPGSTWWEWDHARAMFIYHRHDYDRTSHYFLTDSQPVSRVIEASVSPGATTQRRGLGVAGYIGDQVNLAESGREHLSESFHHGKERQLGTGIQDIDPSGTTRVYARMAAQSHRDTHFDFYAGSERVHRLTIPGIPQGLIKVRMAEVREGLFSVANSIFDGNLRIGLERLSPSAQGWINHVSINTHRLLEWSGKSMQFYSDSVWAGSAYQTLGVSGLPKDGEVWDVTDAHSPVRFVGSAASVPGNQRRLLHAFTKGGASEPRYVGPVANQNLHGMAVPEMLIVSHSDFLSMAHSVADIYRESPLTHLESEVVNVEDVYREFSSGNRDASAIRNLIRMLYWRGGGPSGRLRYVLLVGKALYTLVDQGGDINYVPNYQSSNSYDKGLSYGTDDFYGLLDPEEGGGEGGLDLGVGRYTVVDQETADAVLSHERAYHNPANWGDWIARVLFLSDDDDGNVFTENTEDLAVYVEGASPSTMVTRVHADAFHRQDYWYKNRYPNASAAINAQIDRGAYLFNYLGHASAGVIGYEEYIKTDNIGYWQNLNRQPIFVAASCLLARYDLPQGRTIGEIMLFSPRGGMVAMIASSRIAYSSSNYNFNMNLMRAMFPQASEEAPQSLGDAFYRGKARTVNVSNKRKYALLGNPALPVPNPNAKATAITLNGSALQGRLDTVRAGSLVRMGFTLQHADGSPFEGEAFVTMQGPRMTLKTHGNNNTRPVSISEHVGTAFRGKVTVRDGKAEAEWRVPVDMDCDYQQGKVNVVGTSRDGLCIGSYVDFTFGGRDSARSTDRVGPIIEVSLNDWVRRTEWHVNESPLLLARLRDSSGISLSQLSPLQVRLKGPNGMITHNLNDFFTSDKDSYQSGNVEYRFSNLDTGTYRLVLTAHDTQGNRSEASMSFHVVSARETKVSRLLNYPNPFTGGTSFYFDTTKPGVASRVLIQIFTVDGDVVKTLHAFEPNPGARMGPYYWDGRDDYGQPLARGVYFYRVRLTSLRDGGSEDSHSEEFERLLKL